MYRRDDGPSEYVLYDRTSGKSEPLFVSQPSLLEYEFAHMEDVRIPARDGLELVAYLTRAQTGKLIEEIASNDKCNCGGVLLDDDTKEVRAVSFNYARTERSFFDAELEKDFKKLEAAGAKDSEVTISSRTRTTVEESAGFIETASRTSKDSSSVPHPRMSPGF